MAPAPRSTARRRRWRGSVRPGPAALPARGLSRRGARAAAAFLSALPLLSRSPPSPRSPPSLLALKMAAAPVGEEGPGGAGGGGGAGPVSSPRVGVGEFWGPGCGSPAPRGPRPCSRGDSARKQGPAGAAGRARSRRRARVPPRGPRRSVRDLANTGRRRWAGVNSDKIAFRDDGPGVCAEATPSIPPRFLLGVSPVTISPARASGDGPNRQRVRGTENRTRINNPGKRVGVVSEFFSHPQFSCSAQQGSSDRRWLRPSERAAVKRRREV